jgi:hypothetical protein
MLHLAGDLEADDVGFTGRRRITAEPLQQVGAVYAGGADADDQVAFARLRIGHFRDLEDLGPARLLHDDGAHGRLLL